MAAHIEKSINCIMLMGGGFILVLDLYIFRLAYVFYLGGCHRLWSSCILGKYGE
jgi:hypothetical protein